MFALPTTARNLIRPAIISRAAFHQAALLNKIQIHSNRRQPITMSTPEQRGKITNWASNDGSFKRQTSSFRDAIEKGGKFEPEKGEGFSISAKPDTSLTLLSGRYHLYVSLAWYVQRRRSWVPVADWPSSYSPWAHRTLIVRKLKGLEEFFGMLQRVGHRFA